MQALSINLRVIWDCRVLSLAPMSSHVHVDEETRTPKAFNIQVKYTSTTVSYIYFISNVQQKCFN